MDEALAPVISRLRHDDFVERTIACYLVFPHEPG